MPKRQAILPHIPTPLSTMRPSPSLTLTERQLLALLSAGLGFSQPEEGLFGKDTDWAALCRMAERQSVTGVVFDGAAQLPAALRPPKEVLLPWYARVEGIARSNRHVNGVLAEAVRRYRAAGLDPVLLKGQGVARHYPDPLRRQPGDIDLYFATGYERANREAARWKGAQAHAATSYHQSFTWRGVEIENHLKYADYYHPLNRRRWRRAVRELPPVGSEALPLEGGTAVSLPAPLTDALYLPMHLQHHLLQMGVGLRQLCDWLCLLRAECGQIDCAAFERLRHVLPLARLTDALGLIAVRHLGFPEGCLPFRPDSRRARRDAELLLRDMLDTGNFGHDTALARAHATMGSPRQRLRAATLLLRRMARMGRFSPGEPAAYTLYWLWCGLTGRTR